MRREAIARDTVCYEYHYTYIHSILYYLFSYMCECFIIKWFSLSTE